MADGGFGHLRRGTLDNGLTWTIWPEPRDTVATVQVWVSAGTADERRGESGIAHMLEHMMFRGTRSVPDGEFDARVEALGLYVNAATWLDYTFYTATGPAPCVEELLALEADRFANLTVDEEAFVPERDVVANERRQMVDAVPEAALGEAFHEALFDDSSYCWPTIGWAEDIGAYSADRVRAFHRSNYAAGRLHLVVVGNVDPDAVAAAIARDFGGLAGGAPRPTRRREAPGKPRFATRTLPLSSTRVLAGWRSPARAGADWPAWVVLDELLAAADSSRLTRRLELDEHLVIDMSSVLYGLAGPGALELTFTLRRGVEPGQVMDALRDEVRTLASGPIDDEELAGAVARVRTGRCAALTDTAGRAELLGESWAVQGDSVAGLAIDDAVRRVKIDDVRQAAARILEAEPVVYIGEPA